jgi:flap endonuclease-1
MPAEVRDAVGDPSEVRDIYLHPDVTDDYSIQFGEPDVDGVIKFLCEERIFSRERVTAALERAFPRGDNRSAELPF